MTMPLNFYLVHDGTFREGAESELFTDFGAAVAHAQEMALYEGVPWYVAGCLMSNAVAFTAEAPKKRKPATPKRSETT